MRILDTVLSAHGRFFVFALCATLFGTPSPLRGDDPWTHQIRPFLHQHCTDCHSGYEPEAELDLTAYGDQKPIFGDRETWESILEMLQRDRMPPEEATQPTDSERLAGSGGGSIDSGRHLRYPKISVSQSASFSFHLLCTGFACSHLLFNVSLLSKL